MLKIKKLEKMISEYLKIESPSKDEVDQFITLTKTYEAIQKSISTIAKLNPPQVVNILPIKKPSQKTVIVKDIKMNNCIIEMKKFFHENFDYREILNPITPNEEIILPPNIISIRG